jgi:prepilin-type N-terminal cleavage/methylation domain-containing protein
MNMIEKRKAMAGQGGFTLIELLVVIAILAILGGAAIIGVGALRENAANNACETNKETIALAAEAQKTASNSGSYATNIAGLGSYLKTAPGTGTWAINATSGDVTVTGYANATGGTC